MKALSIWQPWTQLLATGKKKYETRSWRTNYRGPILLHASKKPYSQIEKTMDFCLRKRVRDVLELGFIDWKERIPTGVIIGMADIKDCIEITPEFSEKLRIDHPDEYAFGDFTPGRYAWEMSGAYLFKEPIQAKGYQGIWNYNGPVPDRDGKLCIMPENPYCPACRHGYIENPDPEDASVNVWHCLLEKSECDEREARKV